jgi:tetratricopeptide (TPR) repeat protein
MSVRTQHGLANIGIKSVRAAACLAAVVAFATLPACNRSSKGNLGNDRAAILSEARSLAARAQSAEKSGNLDQAIDLYQQSLALSPDFGAAWNNMGLALMKRGRDVDWIAAQQSFQKAAGALPSDATPYRNLGILYQQRGFEEDALRNFESALAVDPNDIDSLRGAAVSGKFLRTSDQSALDRLRRAQMMETDPTWRELILNERIRVENEIEERMK